MNHQGANGAKGACDGGKAKLVRIGESAGANTRRDFLALMGFTAGAASLAACRAPVQHALPLLAGSDQIVPGVSNYYATTCGGCPSACSLLVKQRDGRPIKIDGNDRSALFGGGTCATGQATVLSLYDGERLKGPLWQGQPAAWREMDDRVAAALAEAGPSQRSIVLLSGSLASPSLREIVAAWSKRYPNFRHVVYDAISFSAMRAANLESFGRAAIPHYRFDRARAIVALEADFLGTWLSPVEFARQYAAGRRGGEDASLHVQFESGLSLTGSNADLRVPVAPSNLAAIAAALLRRVAQKAGMAGAPDAPDPISDANTLDTVAEALWRHRGESLVVSGVQDQPAQIAVNALNAFLGNIGKTVEFGRASLQRAGDDQAMAELVEQMHRGEVHTLLMHGVNPGYDYHDAPRFLAGLGKTALSVSFADRSDETSSQARAICPDHHFLEAWGDAEPVESHFSLAQPLIAPLFDTRSAAESLLEWLGAGAKHYDSLRAFWKTNLFPRQSEIADFDAFWDRTLRDGVADLPLKGANGPEAPAFRADWKAASAAIASAGRSAARDEGRYEAAVYESVAMRDGRHANNPWLQELPDPISKVTWGNYAAIAPKTAGKLGLENGDVVSLDVPRNTGSLRLELPVLIQPGQHSGAIGIALGYGRTRAGKAAQNVGVNAFPLAGMRGGHRQYAAANVSVQKTGRREALALAQTHFSAEDRPIALETTVRELREAAEAGGERAEALPTLWAERLTGEHSWGLAIDTSACTGCSACVIACQAENNVPVVGKDQVQRTRIMHWIRIDHYYRGAGDSPASLHQPMMCQHCGNAPCETVCPVLATTTSSEGLNQQVYNRCIGTRYCANNCPYKVRRFNWYNYSDSSDFEFTMRNPVARMALNPDVAVRTRGVMEKCSLCVQRIQLAKNAALQGRREVADGDIQTACQQACPAQAIVFGDLKDPHSRASQIRRGSRAYQVLDDLGTRPQVAYLKKVRNPLEPA